MAAKVRDRTRSFIESMQQRAVKISSLIALLQISIELAHNATFCTSAPYEGAFMIHMYLRISLFFLLWSCYSAVSGNASNDARITNEFRISLDRSRSLLRSCPVEALKEARLAYFIASEAEEKSSKLESLFAIAEAEFDLGMNEQFLETSSRANELAFELENTPAIARCSRQLSTAYLLTGKPDQALFEARKFLTAVLPLNDQQQITEAQLFLMRALLKAGRHTEALGRSSEALLSCSNDTIDQARVHHVMAQVLIDQEKFADALPFLTKAGRVLELKGNDQEKLQLSFDRSRAMLGLGLTHFAREALQQAERSPILDLALNKEELLQLQYQLALAHDDRLLALGLLQNIVHFTDSVRSAQTKRQIAGLQVHYGARKSEKANAQLRDLNAQQAETIQDQRSNNRYLLTLLAGLLILAVALFITSRFTVRMMRRLARKNEVIRRQNEEIRSKVLELKRQNLRLAESLMSEEEKELILKEIHHRVKNNLQVVDSLLNIQSNDVQDPNSLRLLKEARGRIRSMAMVHEHIYRSSGDMHATLRAHIEKLGRSVLVAHGVHDRISIGVDTELHTFPAETLLPLSLMLNELLTNSIKHAFAEMQAGNIRITIKPAGSGYELRYTDDGHGMENGISNAGTFGHELISILAQQLNGKVELRKGDGIVFTMNFTPDKELVRAAA